jgi:hypothetical protein
MNEAVGNRCGHSAWVKDFSPVAKRQIGRKDCWVLKMARREAVIGYKRRV